MFTNTYVPHVGGVARSVNFFARDLRLLGHNVLIIAPSYAGKNEKKGSDAEVLHVPAIQNFNGSDFSVRIALPFIISEKINDFKPEVIHSHHPFLLGDAALRTARRGDHPLVFTHHTLYENYTHYVPFDSPAMKRFVINLSTEYANLCTKVVAPSRSVANLIRERGVETPVHEIPTGVDLHFFDQGHGRDFRREHDIPEATFVIGHLGRLALEKNLRYLAESVASFIKKNKEAHFLVVGDGPGRDDIEEIFQEIGAGDRLTLAGSLTGQALADAYKAMDLFVFASKTETQGMVLIEAMASGVPVIALNSSGSREILDDGKNGRLLPKDAAPEEFARAILHFYRNPETAEKCGHHALKTAEKFSRKKCAQSLADLYESIINPNKTQDGRDSDELLPWDRLLKSLKVEWDLISKKAAASMESIKDMDKKEGSGTNDDPSREEHV